MSKYDRLKRHARQLVKYKKATSAATKKKLLTKNLKNSDFVKCIGECCKNILNGNVPLTKKQKIQLKKRRLAIRRVASNKTPLKSKKKTIQTGGFLGAIIRTGGFRLGWITGQYLE